MEKLTALRVFRHVVERKSFSRAARDLRLSNASVSKNVRELEAELGAPLIQRTTRRLHTTAAGEAYYARVVAILDALADADRAARDTSITPRGLLRVAMPMSIGLTRMMPAISRFLVEYPELRIELEMNDRVVDVVREGFDLAIRAGSALADSSLVARKLAVFDRVLVASADYVARAGSPRAPAELERHRCLVYSSSNDATEWTLVRGTTRRTVEIAGPLRVNSSLALVQSAVAGVGIALVPIWTAERELAGGGLIRVLEDWSGQPATLQAVYPRHHEVSRTLRLFVDHLVLHLKRTSL